MYTYMTKTTKDLFEKKLSFIKLLITQTNDDTKIVTLSFLHLIQQKFSRSGVMSTIANNTLKYITIKDRTIQ